MKDPRQPLFVPGKNTEQVKLLRLFLGVKYLNGILILSDHTDQEFAVQCLDVVVPG
jgi:hypothetical protein